MDADDLPTIHPLAFLAAYATVALRPKPRATGRRRDPKGRRRRRGQPAEINIRTHTRTEPREDT